MLICGDTSVSSSIIFPVPCQSTRSIKNTIMGLVAKVYT